MTPNTEDIGGFFTEWDDPGDPRIEAEAQYLKAQAHHVWVKLIEVQTPKVLKVW